MKKIYFQAYSRQLRGMILLLADVSAFFLALALEYLLLHFCGKCEITFIRLLRRFWIMPVVFSFIGSLTRIYGGNFFYGCSAVDPPEELKRITLISIGCYLLQISYHSFDSTFQFYRGSRGLPIVLFMILLIPAVRYLVRTLMKRTGVGQTPILIAGGGKSADMLCVELRRDRFYGYEAIGYLDDAETTSFDLRIPRLGTLADALDVARRHKVNTLACCIPIPVLEAYREAWSEFFVQFIIVADVRVLPVNWSYPLNFNSIASVSIGNQLHWPLFRLLKIFAEVVVSLTGILLLALPCFVLAILIKLTSPGPIFFVSTRLGKDGHPFKIYKFRTMYADASEKLKQLLEENPELAQEWERNAKLDDDPRITPLGRFLRKTSLDEIPQFLNILKGEMALIGPRPIVKEEIRHYGDAYKIVSRVKPGITGLWQVSGRSTTTYETRVRLDLFYVSNWSIWLDYFILLKTVKEVLLRRGAQ